MKQKFSKRSLYTATTKGKNIPKSEFAGSQTSFSFASKKNTEKNPLTGEITNKLSYKVGKAISLSQDTEANKVFLCEYKGHECAVGVFFGGAKNGTELFAIDTDLSGTVAFATNVNSHFLPQVVMTIDRYKHPKEEIDLWFRRIQFDTPEKVIGIDQKEAFLTLADSLRIEISKLDGYEFEEDFDLEFIKANFEFKKNITPYLKNDKEHWAHYAKDLVVTDADGGCNVWNRVNDLPLDWPEEITAAEMPVTPSTRTEHLKQQYYNGISTYSADEIKKMPLILQNGYEMARHSFMTNRDFFGAQEWELVDAIACGDVHSINFTGPAGVGKTTTIRSIAGALGMPFVLVGGSANIEEADLLGTRGVEAKDGVSVTTWTDGPITTAIRYGAFLLFDEVNSAEPGILMKLNTILDGSRSLILSTAEEVRVHPNFVYSEAMNVGAGYVGTDVLNQSHLDRCDEIFKIASKAPKEEAKIIAAATGYDNIKNIEKLCEVKRYICRLIEEDGDASEQSCSPRRIIAWVKKARRTGEFVESSLSTVISHISIYDDSFSTLSVDEVMNSSGIAASAMQMIQDKLKDVRY